MSVLVRAKTVFISIVLSLEKQDFSCKNDGLTVFPNKHMEKSRTYHGLLHVLVREKTVYL